MNPMIGQARGLMSWLRVSRCGQKQRTIGDLDWGDNSLYSKNTLGQRLELGLMSFIPPTGGRRGMTKDLETITAADLYDDIRNMDFNVMAGIAGFPTRPVMRRGRLSGWTAKEKARGTARERRE